MIRRGVPPSLPFSPTRPGRTPVRDDEEPVGFSGYRQGPSISTWRNGLPPVIWGKGPLVPEYHFDQTDERRSKIAENILNGSQQKTLRAPKWLEGRYRPRLLTEAGLAALEQAAPGGPGIRPYPPKQVTSMKEMRDYLAQRYIAFDLLERGLVVESAGLYIHQDNLGYGKDRDINRTHKGWWNYLSNLTRSKSSVTELDLLKWLAIGRSMSIDQIISIDPDNAKNNIELLWILEKNKIVDRIRLFHGEGSWEAYSLSQKAWKNLTKEYPNIKEAGYGPHHSIGNNRDFHESLQVDALNWFITEIELGGGKIESIQLEGALRRKAMKNFEHSFLDFKIYHTPRNGITIPLEVEVIGVGSTYRSKSRMANLHSMPTIRTFSPQGHSINLGKNVVIGR